MPRPAQSRKEVTLGAHGGDRLGLDQDLPVADRAGTAPHDRKWCTRPVRSAPAHSRCQRAISRASRARSVRTGQQVVRHPRTRRENTPAGEDDVHPPRERTRTGGGTSHVVGECRRPTAHPGRGPRGAATRSAGHRASRFRAGCPGRFGAPDAAVGPGRPSTARAVHRPRMTGTVRLSGLAAAPHHVHLTGEYPVLTDLGYLRPEGLVAHTPGTRRPATTGVSQELGAFLTPAPVSTVRIGQAPNSSFPASILVSVCWQISQTGTHTPPRQTSRHTPQDRGSPPPQPQRVPP
ncbi:Uncharacterised protein [Actinomyces viscosus]|uniref:Uncharacterized protein n=1 Tax=Actinomyces viscosus TaxID=1656 RepID=A0A448PN50_ACTVI|nr:Uncharacterised protein [Actinomyces viscosus]